MSISQFTIIQERNIFIFHQQNVKTKNHFALGKDRGFACKWSLLKDVPNSVDFAVIRYLIHTLEYKLIIFICNG